MQNLPVNLSESDKEEHYHAVSQVTIMCTTWTLSCYIAGRYHVHDMNKVLHKYNSVTSTDTPAIYKWVYNEQVAQHITPTIAEAIKIQHINIFGICEDVRHFSHHSYNVTINSHNSQLTLHTDSQASERGKAGREGRTILGAQAKSLYSQMVLSRKPFGIGNMFI
jgi:hypothetical protein